MRLSVNVKFFFVWTGGRVFCLWCRHMGDLISEWLLLRPIFLTPTEEQMSFETNSNSQDDETWGKFNQLDELNIETSRTRRHTMLLCDETKMLTETFFSVTKLFDTRNLKRLESGSSLEQEKLFRTWNLRNHRTPTKQPLIPWIFPNPATRHNFIWDLSFLKALDRNIVVHYSEWDGQEGQKGWVMTSHLPPTAPTTAHQLSITS